MQDGDDGSPGQPGISLWKVSGRSSTPDNILIPPRISGGPYDSDQVLDIKESCVPFLFKIIIIFTENSSIAINI